MGGSCGAGQPASQSANGQSLLYGLQVSTSSWDLQVMLSLVRAVYLVMKLLR